MTVLWIVGSALVGWQIGYWFGRRDERRFDAGTELAVKARTAGLIANHRLIIERTNTAQIAIIKGGVAAGVMAAQAGGKLTEIQAATLLGFTMANYRRQRASVYASAVQLHQGKH